MHETAKQLYEMLRHAKQLACSLACCPASLCVHIASSALLTLSAMRRNLFYAERHDFTTLQEKHQ